MTRRLRSGNQETTRLVISTAFLRLTCLALKVWASTLPPRPSKCLRMISCCLRMPGGALAGGAGATARGGVPGAALGVGAPALGAPPAAGPGVRGEGGGAFSPLAPAAAPRRGPGREEPAGGQRGQGAAEQEQAGRR